MLKLVTNPNKAELNITKNPWGKGVVIARHDGLGWKLFIDICFSSVDDAIQFCKIHFGQDAVECEGMLQITR